MNRFWDKAPLRPRPALAVAGGLMLAAAFPKIGVAGLGWIAPALMLGAGLGTAGRGAFRLGYLAGLVHYLVSLHWLLFIPYRWLGLPLAPGVGWLALSAFLALGPAAWVWLVAHLGRLTSPRTPSVDDFLGRATDAAEPSGSLSSECIPGSWSGRVGWGLTAAAAWVALEMILARIFGGFPWNFLGASQYQMAPLLQLASVTGVYGLSFLMVWFSVGLVCAALTMIRRPATRSVWMAELFLPLLASAAVFNLGWRAIRHTEPSPRTLAVTLVQPGVPQTLIWDSEKNPERLQDLLQLCEQALTNQTDLLVLPEGGVPGFLRYDEKTAEAMSALARRHHVWIITGSDDFEHTAGSARPEDGDYYNGCFLINPDGELAGKGYHKRNLVIFGEYVPCLRWLPFLKWFTPITGAFTPGSSPGLLSMPEAGATGSALICYEDVFPQLDSGGAQQGLDFLVNVTNDGWFGNSSEQWQHAASALFRAVEQGVPLIRCANNGITCWVDAQGRLRDTFLDPKGSAYGAGFMRVEVSLPPLAAKAGRTVYARHGDWFGWGCVAATGLLVGRLWWHARGERRKRKQREVC